MIKIAIAGAGGRMGRELALAALIDPEIEIVAAVEAAGSPVLGADLGALCGQPEIGVAITTDFRRALGKVDVFVEFTVPAATVEHVVIAAELGRAAVLGTTGLDRSQTEVVRDAAARIPVIMSANMSVGVNVLMRVAPMIAALLGSSYDIEIVEAHHHGKQDAPSGTALKLAEAIADGTSRRLDEIATYGRKGIAPRKPGEIGIHAVRAGGIVGDHRIIMANEGEQIEIVHRAFNRQNFALGALRAAKFTAERPPGFYTMHDVLSS